MKRNGFTFIELLLVVICIGILVTGAGFSFKRAKASHLADTFAQEFVILKTAIETYYESHGTLPELNGKLSSFSVLENFWKPFNPDVSNVLPNTYWYGNMSTELQDSYLELYRYTVEENQRLDGTSVVFSEVELAALEKKMASICFFEKNSGKGMCYIFREPNASETSQSPSNSLK